MRTILLSSVALMLAACSPPAADKGAGAAPEAQTTAPGSAGPGAQLRLGRWSKVMTVMGNQTTEVECITNADLNQLASDPSSNCTSTSGFQRTPEGLVYEAECTGADGGGHVRTVMNGDLQNHYVVDSTMTGKGDASSMRFQMHIEGTYEGACRGDE